jgi:cysteinyl-tRNA synthetase
MAGMTRKDLEDCRLDILPEKKSPLDVLLWNASENFDVGFHDEILGSGIPWWHMQDTSVAIASFGGSYDIHGGASELVYPHHESHLAQLQALTSRDKPVRFWTHVGLIQIKGKKMSKSMHNTVAVRDLLKRHSPNALRLYFYSKHYRDDFDFAEKELDSFEQVNDNLAASVRAGRVKKQMAGKFFKYIANDFDTPRALKVLYEAARARSTNLDAVMNAFGLRY